MKKSVSNLCVIDYIDERFKLLKLDVANSVTYITKSNELVNSGFLKNRIYEEIQYEQKKGIWQFDGMELDPYLDKFLKNILGLYKGKTIILHKAYMCDLFLSDGGETKQFSHSIRKNNLQLNTMLQHLYDYTEVYLQKYAKKYYVIDLCNKYGD